MAEKFGRKVKEVMVEEMKETFTGNRGFVFSNIENIKANDFDEFRKKMKKAGSRYFVLKNRIAKIAFRESGIEGLDDVFENKKVTGIGLITDDPVNITKIMVDFSKSSKGFLISKGYLEGKVLSEERIRELSEMPSRDELIARLVGTINAPVSNFVNVLATLIKNLMFALDAIKEKKEKESK